MFLKFGRRGDPHWRRFSLVWLDNNRGAAIRWETKKKTKTPEIKIAMMREVRFGQNSAVFKRKTMPHLNSLSFTILYSTGGGKEETLDLIAKHPDDFFIWTVGIKHAIKNGIGASNVEASAWERAEEEADLELMAEMDDYEIFDDHDDGGGEDDHEEEDDRLITTGNVMFSWGFNGWGQLGLVEQYPSQLRDPFKKVNVALAAAGEQHVLFLGQTGEVYTCGLNDCGQLGVGHLTDVGQPAKVDMGGDVSIKGIAAGHSISAAVTSDGKIYTWGCGMYGALGHGDEENRQSPEEVKTTKFDCEVKSVSCGQYHMAAILCNSADPAFDGRTKGGGSVTSKNITKVTTWGWNGCGQLGLGDFEDRHSPQVVEVISGGGKVVEQIVCGAAHCAAVVNLSMGELEIQGQLWTWGNGVAALATADAAHAEIPRPFHLTKKGHESIEVFRIAAGDNFTLVLDDEGSLMVIGVHPIHSNGKNAMTGQGLEIEKAGINGVDGIVTEIAAGGRHIAVLAPKRFAYSSLLA
ncbi:hypothetical protein TeGR_g9245 [Tetraparma gracilis]|uniref:Uncharacterized protein n=1 Tax=Tetraparma gracilis TaxID=2962635 RepID=A0ABQ6MNU0_9STRA|nr:hypothetical protein TeGR_g9245 [Tetraparma gracilis]